MLKIKNLNLEINNKKILSDISFEVRSWEIFNILGPNWSWKTSLLKSIIWLNKVSGEILFINGKNQQGSLAPWDSWDSSHKSGLPQGESLQELFIPERSNLGVNYIMQEIPEYTGVSVETYLKWVLKDKFDLEKVSKMFDDFGLDYQVYKTRYFDSHLSWWERKKVEIITNFLMDKDLYLLDEIEASLDANSRQILIDLILSYQQKEKTFIIVSHSKDILQLAQNWILLCNWEIEDFWENSKLLKKYFWSCEGYEGEECKK